MMKSTVEIDRSLNETLTVLVSACVHAVLMVGICCSASVTEKKPEPVATKLIELKTVKAEIPSLSKPEPPKPEPKPEPPKPEPKPEPPKPERKPDPPKPKPVEVKPPPPKPQPSVVKNEKPLQDVKPTKTLTPQEKRQQDLRRRLEAAQTKEMTAPQPRPNRPVPPPRTPTADELKAKFSSRLSNPQNLNMFASSQKTQTEAVSEDYAQRYVYPVFDALWQPSRAGMRNPNPSPVMIAFRVTPSGGISNIRITVPSNEPVMNNMVNALIRQNISLTPFSEAGVSRSFLDIEIVLSVK